MPKTFMEALTRNGVSWELRADYTKPSEMTLSNGQRVRLIDQVKVTHFMRGKKVVRYEYTICRAEIIR